MGAKDGLINAINRGKQLLLAELPFVLAWSSCACVGVCAWPGLSWPSNKEFIRRDGLVDDFMDWSVRESTEVKHVHEYEA